MLNGANMSHREIKGNKDTPALPSFGNEERREFPDENLFKGVEIRKRIQGKWINQVVSVVQEIPFTIFLNRKEIVTLLCTGTHLEALAIGFLKSEGLIDKREDIQDITLDEESGLVSIKVDRSSGLQENLFMKRITITSGCGKGTMFYHAIDSLLTHKIESSLKITADQIFLLMSELTQQSTLYKNTRGVHNVALATTEEILLFRADIGRHNAVDMIYGKCFLENIPLEDKILLTTGRITSEVLLKVAKMRIPFLISRHVATHHAFTLARDIGITVIGDVRGGKFIVYTHSERVKE